MKNSNKTTVKSKQILLGVIFLIFCSSNVYSQGTGTLSKGMNPSKFFNHYGCKVGSITVKWKIRSLMGEPVIGGSYKWEAYKQGVRRNNIDRDCLSYKDFIVLEVKGNNGGRAYLTLDPTTPKAGQGYAYNVSGSPSWSKLFCSYDKYGNAYNCWSEDRAKQFWKNGFKVTDFALKRSR